MPKVANQFHGLPFSFTSMCMKQDQQLDTNINLFHQVVVNESPYIGKAKKLARSSLHPTKIGKQINLE